MIQHLPSTREQVLASPPDDEQVIAEVLGGDPEAFATLVRRYQETLFRFAFTMVGNADAAADLVQESFLKAYTTLARCREPSRFGAWIHRIVRNRCLDYLKRHRRHERLEPGSPQLVHESEAEANLERRELRAALVEALSTLPEAQREAFLLKHFEDRSYEEMAEMMDASVSALKMRVKRAREALMAALSRATGVT